MARTLYLRNVPDEVVERLTVLAEREGMSTSAFAVRELIQVSRRADKAAVLAALPDLGIDSATVVAAIRAGREERMAHLDEVIDARHPR